MTWDHIEHGINTLYYALPLMGLAKWLGVTAWRWLDDRNRAHHAGA